MSIYQSNIYNQKDLSWLPFNNEPMVQGKLAEVPNSPAYPCHY